MKIWEIHRFFQPNIFSPARSDASGQNSHLCCLQEDESDLDEPQNAKLKSYRQYETTVSYWVCCLIKICNYINTLYVIFDWKFQQFVTNLQNRALT